MAVHSICSGHKLFLWWEHRERKDISRLSLTFSRRTTEIQLADKNNINISHTPSTPEVHPQRGTGGFLTKIRNKSGKMRCCLHHSGLSVLRGFEELFYLSIIVFSWGWRKIYTFLSQIVLVFFLRTAEKNQIISFSKASHQSWGVEALQDRPRRWNIKKLLLHASFFIHFSWMWDGTTLIKVVKKRFEIFSKDSVPRKPVWLKFPTNKLQLAL